MKEFEKRFPKKNHSIKTDQEAVDFWRKKQQEGWREALKYLDNAIRDIPLDYGYEVRDWIKEELEKETAENLERPSLSAEKKKSRKEFFENLDYLCKMWLGDPPQSRE